MSEPGLISRQLTDLAAYVLLPAVSLVIPASLSRRLLSRASGWAWLLSADAEKAFAGARKHLEIPDPEPWKQRWKQVELLDVRDLYMMLSGRARTVLQEIDRPPNLEIARDRVLVGMHWGPAISILKLLSESGLRPAFPFRLPEPQLLRTRPFYYVFTRLATRYLSQTLADRAVPVGGAGKVLQRMLDEPGSICVLMDAPPMAGRPSISKQVLGSPASFNAGFPAMLAERGKEYVLYAMNLADDGSLRKKLELAGPFRADNSEEFLDKYAAFLDRHLSSDSPHWRIWRAEHQFWSEPV
jgi:hypothetical protein